MSKRQKSKQRLLDSRTKSPFQEERKIYQAGKPQVWVRLRPLPNSDDSVFEVSQDGKALKLSVPTETNRIPPRPTAAKFPSFLNQGLDFKADGVLSNSSQEETYLKSVHDVVDKAMNGVSGVIVALGPELSGKNFTMFGTRGKFQHRGVVPRTLESIFSYVEAKGQEMSYSIRIGVIEIRGDRIRDLITLCPYDLKTIGDEGPNGMLLQQIGCVEHGLVLLIRALAGQRYISGPSYSHCHTVVYLDIEGHTLQECQPRFIKSRITFARIAAIPKRSKDIIVSVNMANKTPFQVEPDGCAYYCGPRTTKPYRPREPSPIAILDSDPYAKSNRTVSVDISIRRDLSFLEQMFIRVNELKKLYRKYAKLKRHGAEMLMKPPKTSPAQTYRQNKLSHCLQDIISGNSEVRIMLLVRPERQYLTTTLEALRFAERAKYIPTDHKHPEPPTPEELERQLKCNQEKAELERQQKEQAEIARKEQEAAELAAKLAAQAASLAQMNANNQEANGGPRKSSKAGSGGVDGADGKGRRRRTMTRDTDRSDYDVNSGRGKKKRDREREKAARKNKRKLTGSEEATDTTKTPETDIPSGSEKTTRVSFAGSDQGQLQEHLPSENGSPRTSNAEQSDQPPETAAEVPINPKITGVNVEGNAVTFDWTVEGETVDPAQSIMKSEPPSIPEAWSEFVKTPNGIIMNQEMEKKHKVLRDMTTEHNDVLQKATILLTVLNQQQSDLDIAQQIRHLRGDDYDNLGNIVLTQEEREVFKKVVELQASRDDILEKLKNLKSQMYAQKLSVDAGKKECEAAFQLFCVDKYAMVFGNVDDVNGDFMDQQTLDQMNNNTNSMISKCNMKNLQAQTEAEATKHFEDLKHIGEEQAKQFIRYYYQRPPWNNFATLKHN